MENQQIVIASLVGVAIVVILLIFFLRRPRKKNPSLPADQDLFAERYFEDDTVAGQSSEKFDKVDKKNKTATRNYSKPAPTKMTCFGRHID
jgi:hypothetical protein